MPQVQCFSCKQFGHIACNCRKFCNYCKKQGHIIANYPHVLHDQHNILYKHSMPQPMHLLVLLPNVYLIVVLSNLKTIQQIVHFALSTLGIQGKFSRVSYQWFLDSGASIHMMGSFENLHNVNSYNGTQKIQMVVIFDIGDLNPNFRNVLVSPGVASNLLLVGQLVDNNYDVKVWFGGK